MLAGLHDARNVCVLVGLTVKLGRGELANHLATIDHNELRGVTSSVVLVLGDLLVRLIGDRVLAQVRFDAVLLHAGDAGRGRRRSNQLRR